MSRLFGRSAASFRDSRPRRSPLSQRGSKGDLATCELPNGHERQGCVAGGARRRITFFACAKKVIKESTPCFRRNPRLVPKSTGGSQTRPAGSYTLADFPRGFGHQPAASEGGMASLRDGLPPSEPPRLGESFGGFRRVCLSPAGVSYAAARSFRPVEETRRAAKRGGLLLVTFLGQARKVTCRRATTGQTRLVNKQH